MDIGPRQWVGSDSGHGFKSSDALNLIWSDHTARFRANLIILDVSDLVWLLTARRVIGKVVEEFIFNLLAELFGLFIGIVTFLLVSTQSTISSEVRPFYVA